MKVVIEMKLYISLKDYTSSMKFSIINIQFMELSKVVLENLHYLYIAQLSFSTCGAWWKNSKLPFTHYNNSNSLQ